MTDLELIAAAKAGDQDAFTELHTRHIAGARAVAHKILRTDDVDDVCQESFVLAFARLDSFRGEAKFRTWLTRIVLNQCLMVLRDRRCLTHGSDNLVDIYPELGEEPSELPHERVFVANDPGLRSAEARLDLPKMLATLKPTHRQIVELRYIEGFAPDEIALLTGKTVGAVGGILYNSLRRLREKFSSPVLDETADNLHLVK